MRPNTYVILQRAVEEGALLGYRRAFKKIENPTAIFSIGEERIAKIIKMNPKEKKISLSFRQAQMEMQKQEYQKYMDHQDNKLTFGDIMKDQLNKISSPKKKTTKKEEKND